MNRNQTRIMITIGIAVTTLGLAWASISRLPPAALQATLILALGLLPVAFWIGWKMGSRDAQMFLSGLDKGAERVIKASGRVADLRASQVTQARRAARPQVQLPDATRFEIVNVQPTSEQEAIEL